METMGYLRPPRTVHARFLIALTLAFFLTGGASATAGLRPDPKPQPQPQPQPLPEPPPQTRVSPQPPPAQPPVSEPAPPVNVRAPNRPARTAHDSTDKARRAAKRAAARVRREKATATRTAGRGTQRPATREVAPLAFSDSQSNVGTALLVAMVAIAASLLLFGFGVTPARVARWPAAARVLEGQGDLLVTTGFAILAASAAFLLVFLTVP
jgi:hypothetical protein